MKTKLQSALRSLLMIIVMTLFAVPTMADNCEFEHDYNFTAYNKGRGVIHFKLLVFAEGSSYNHWAGESGSKISNVYVEYGGHSTKVFSYHGDNDKNKYDKKHIGYSWITMPDNMGRLVVTNLYSGSKSQPYEVMNNERFEITRESNGRKRVFLEVDWYMPEYLATENLKVKAYINDKRCNKYWNRNYDLVTYEAADPLSTPELYDPVFYPTAGVNTNGRANMAVPYSTIYKPQQYVTTQVATPTTTDKLADMIMVETKDVEQRFTVTMDLITNDAGAISTLKTNEVIIPAYHSISNFKVSEQIDTVYARSSYDATTSEPIPVNRGYKRLTWTIPNAHAYDVMDMDVFEVQRAYQKDFSDAVTIGSVDFEPYVFQASKDTDDEESAVEGSDGELTDDEVFHQNYEYVDSTEYATYNRDDPTQPIYYRIRRATASSWGWDHVYAASGFVEGNVEQAGLVAPVIKRDGEYAVRYENNHEVVIEIMTPETSARPVASEKIQPMWWDEHAMIKIQRGDTHTEGVSIPVIADSLRLIHTRDIGGQPLYRWQYRFVDEMPTACEVYDYRVTVDTTTVQIKTITKQSDTSGTYSSQLAMTADGTSKSSFQFIPVIDKIEASQGEYKSHVVITWEPSASGIETYDVLRNGSVIASDIVETCYLDSTAVGGREYEYCVRGSLVCRDKQTTLSATVTGFRSPYGSIEGNVFNLNGTAMSHTTVRIRRGSESSPQYSEAVAPERILSEYVVETDENGHFFADSLVYSLTGTTFQIVPESPYALFDRAFSEMIVTTTSPEGHVKEFVNSAMIEFSGRVLYEGSTVPVSGVQFLLDGTPLKNSNGQLITSDNLGNFSVTVPKNYAFTLQAVKEGHQFLQDGYFYVNGKQQIILEKNQPGMHMYDQTKVRLIGRVVGGNIEGSHPLGFGLSTNNLGDNLQLVLELEGDNISHLVYDERDPAYQSRTDEYPHFITTQSGSITTLTREPSSGPAPHTTVLTTTKRITISPDPLSGEYQLDLFPARYRVVQATADGYSSLLAAGTAMPVIDLTDSIRSHTVATQFGSVDYNAQYAVIYHSPINVTYDQMQYGRPLNYIGEKQYNFFNLSMEEKPLQLIRETTSQPNSTREPSSGPAPLNQYVLGYPLFRSGSIYNLRVQAHEDYYYNNQPNGRHTQVMLAGCPVKLYNGFDTSSSLQSATLDDEGTNLFLISANNTDFSLTGRDALRTLSISVYVDGEYVQATPLQGYVTGSRIKGGNAINNPYVTEVARTITIADILRDPPGRDSYAYIESGAHYETYLLTHNTFVKGIEVDLKIGSSYKNVTGVSAGAGPFTGTVMEGSSATVVPMPLTSKKTDYRDYTYSFDTKERITTSSAPGIAGMPSTVFIGTEPCIYTTINESFSVIDSEAYQRVLPAINSGNVRIVAEGIAPDGKPIYLAISEELGFATGFDGHFVYSENYIVTSLLPQLMRERDALLLLGSHDEVQAIANRLSQRQYRSTVPADSPLFGTEYEVIDPTTVHTAGAIDRVAALNDYIMEWVGIIQREEATLVSTKYNRKQLLSSYNLSGASIDYSETTTYRLGFQNKDMSSTMGGTVKGLIGTGLSAAGAFGLGKGMDKIFGTSFTHFQDMLKVYRGKPTEGRAMEGVVPGSTWRIDFKPVIDYQFKESNHAANGRTRTVGFHLADDTYNHMNVEVYRVVDETNGFTKTANELLKEAASYDNSVVYNNEAKSADFVYYVNGGATRAPHREPAYTTFYLPGTKIDNGTLNMEIPRINVNTYEISNVPEGESAIFDLQLSLESETQENVTFARKYKLFLLDDSNTHGAGLFIDGQPIAGGRVFELVPGKSVFHKMLEVRQGVGYDFEDIRLRLRSEDDATCYADVNLSVHYIPSSSPVKLSLISNNWLLNTLSPRDTTGYYLPVEITGFDVNYRNFDHIEFQYKLTSQSNDSWVNLCSYYADEELYQKASGNKGRITNGIISNIHFYGERDPMEQQYDLRAVSYCRLGTGYVSRSSEVFTGRKDTRQPQVFGSVTPKNGILGPGDYISIPFSEDIAANYLDEDNNFQIYGYTNSSGITNTTSLLFDGSEGSVALSQSQRSLGSKGFTLDMMVKPSDSSAEYTYFSLNDENRDMMLAFGQKSGRLELTMKGEDGTSKKVTSKALPTEMGWTRVAATYDGETGAVNFYIGSEDITRPTDKKARPGFNITGLLAYGGGNPNSLPMKGNMLEARLWNKPLDAASIAQTNQCSLSGYESGLVAYYPMNDGSGVVAKDQAHGDDLSINGASWSLPAGRSLHFDGTNGNGVQLDEQEFAVNSMSDYTLSLWFKADMTQSQDTVAIFAAGRGVDYEEGAYGKLFIGLENGHLALRQNGFSVVSEGNYLDDEWHNVAVTVAHDVNSATIYVDGEALRTFAGDVLTGITTKDLYLGACHWFAVEGPGQVTKGDTYPFRGYIDDVKFYNTAMTLNQYNCERGRKPLLDDVTLKCYLPFQRSELSNNGRLETVFSPYNAKQYFDVNGKPIEKDVRLIKTADEVVAPMASEITAPIRDAAEPTKLAFSWVGKENELVVNINMTDYEINHQNIFLTVRDVEDKAGNMLASPVSMTVFVDKNPLKWRDSYAMASVAVGNSVTIESHIYNRTGKTINYTIENIPEWVTVEGADGYMHPEEDAPIFITVKDDIEPGYYTALMQLTDDEGLSDAIMLVVDVESVEPDIDIDSNLTQSMNVVAQVMVPSAANDSEYVVDMQTGDIVYAFIGDVCAGKQKITRNTGTTANLMMTVHGDVALSNLPVHFGLWQSLTGHIYVLSTEGADIRFDDNKLYGSTSAPIVMRTTDKIVQSQVLNKGWNWVSLYAAPDKLENSFLQTSVFTPNDLVKTNYGQRGFSTYMGNNKWQGSISDLDYHQMYMFYVQKPGVMNILGKHLCTNEELTISLNGGWNELPYLLEHDEDVNTALSDYFGYASESDIVKGYNEFALFDAHSNKWIGSLTKLRRGHGYMLLRNNPSACSITYHSHHMHSAKVPARAPMTRTYATENGTNMPVVAMIENCSFDLEPGDRLEAYATGRLAGEAEVEEDGRFFLMVHADEGESITFAISRDGDKIASTTQSLNYSSRKTVGSLRMPYIIDFEAKPGEAVGAFYDLYGRQVSKATKPGIYIRKNQKVIVK